LSGATSYLLDTREQVFIAIYFTLLAILGFQISNAFIVV